METTGPGVTQPAAIHDATKQFQTPDWVGKDAATVEKRYFGSFATMKTESEMTGSQANLGSDEELKGLKHVDTRYTTYELQASNGMLYRDGQLVLQPAPSKDPRDPLNLPLGRKIVAVTCLCFFGAFAAAAELILGSMLPVFVLEYAHIPPKLLVPLTKHGLPPGDPLANLAGELVRWIDSVCLSLTVQ